MKYAHMLFAISALSLLALIGCRQPLEPVITHKLVATGNEHSVPMYPNEQSYLHTSQEKQSGGVEGVVGDVKENFTAKQIDDQTPVQVVNSDQYGDVVIVTDGPMKGQSGFVAKQNLD